MHNREKIEGEMRQRMADLEVTRRAELESLDLDRSDKERRLKEQEAEAVRVVHLCPHEHTLHHLLQCSLSYFA